MLLSFRLSLVIVVIGIAHGLCLNVAPTSNTAWSNIASQEENYPEWIQEISAKGIVVSLPCDYDSSIRKKGSDKSRLGGEYNELYSGQICLDFLNDLEPSTTYILTVVRYSENRTFSFIDQREITTLARTINLDNHVHLENALDYESCLECADPSETIRSFYTFSDHCTDILPDHTINNTFARTSKEFIWNTLNTKVNDGIYICRWRLQHKVWQWEHYQHLHYSWYNFVGRYNFI